ncbi:D-alanyl-D-alanine carboxypeptidase family protein [Chelatococcus reniformis]|uniref:serine-type D-Ala-D-Ala carboxypeptidase n=1 Tax=Chelatococcus reniformis TaxID=1494448 RepID=A0A916XAL2_9HYPH|nr:D-alanyl-D-alanine carboxypeptidase family protein [Chelatococcus reniformis]GGC56610.1 D-alanyl-D-alanine carboxypeptidase [Chelatococcus reniformis]
MTGPRISGPSAGQRRRGAVAAALAGLCLLGLTAIATAAAQPKETNFQSAAQNALLVDDATGVVLYEKAADEPFAPASMTKIMTAAVVFEELRAGRLNPDTEFRVSENAWRKGGAPSGGSAMFAALGSRVRVDDLLRGLLVQAGNDAAIVLAEGIAGSEANFAGLMNKRAQEIGLTKSFFVNATGLPDPAQRMSARDLARLAKHVIHDYPREYAYFGEREFTWNKIRQLNRNPLITLEIGADGLSTGYTEEGGYALAGSAVQNDQRLIAILGGLKSAKDRATESRKLLDWGFRFFESRDLFAATAPVGEAEVFGGASGAVPLIAKQPVKLLAPRGSTEKVVVRIIYKGPLAAPVAADKEVARLIVMRGDIQALELPLYTQTAVPKGSLPARAVDAAVELSTGFIRRAFKKI